MKRFIYTVLLFSLVALAYPSFAAAAETWLRPLQPHAPLIWGTPNGIVFGLPSEGGLPGPRGLIRVGIVSPASGRPELLNFIAVEPVVASPGPRSERMAFSELEASQLDPGQRGKRLCVGTGQDGISHPAGQLSSATLRGKTVETLSVPIEVESFSANQAHVYLLASIESDQPDELRLSVHAHDDSPALEELTVTATMGNYERLRQLWLRDRLIDSRSLFGAYTGDAFVEHENYPVEEMLRSAGGDAIVLATTDESDPSASVNPQARPNWRYRLPKLTQYWRVPAHSIEPDLRVRVNARRVYWASHDPLPNGIAFENFEVRQRYTPGQVFIFGVTPKTPQQFEPPIPHLARMPQSQNNSK